MAWSGGAPRMRPCWSYSSSAVASPRRRRREACAFPGGGEPDRLGQLNVAEPVGEQRHGAAAFDGGELFLVPG